MKKIVSVILIAILLSLALPIMAFAGETTPSVSVEQYLTDAIYDGFHDFSDGYAAVCVDGKWGYIDESGKTVVEPQYYWAGDWHGNSAMVMKETDYEGLYENVVLNKDRLKEEEQGYGFYKANSYIWKNEDDGSIGLVRQGNYFAVGEEETWGDYYNAPEGVYIIGGQPYIPHSKEDWGGTIIGTEALTKLYNEGYTNVRSTAPNSNWICSANLIPMHSCAFDSDVPLKAFIMDSHGEIVQEFPTNRNAKVILHDENETHKAPTERYINEILWCSADRMIANSGYTAYLVNEEEQVTEILWKGTYGLYDRQGNLITAFDNYTFYLPKNGMIVIKDENDKWGALDMDGNVAIPVVYDSLLFFDADECSLAYARKDGERFFIDKANHRYSVPKQNGGFYTDGDDVAFYMPKNNIFLTATDKGSYLVAFSGEKFVVIDGSADIVSAPVNGIAAYEKDGKFGFCKLRLEGLDKYDEKTDEPSVWAKDEVEAAIAAGLVPKELQKNYTDGISRADLAKMLSRFLDTVYGKAPEKSDARFTDTTDADVLKAANLGIINGYARQDGTFLFKPANTLKRSEMAAIINRVAKLCGKTTTGYDAEVTFADTTSHWCKGELGWPVHMGIIKGTSTTKFSPENTLTVEQTIMMIYRAYKVLK